MGLRDVSSVEKVLEELSSRNYLADRGLATAVFLSLRQNRPLLLEGEAGVGKTELAKSLSNWACLLYTSPSPRDQRGSRMPSSA